MVSREAQVVPRYLSDPDGLMEDFYSIRPEEPLLTEGSVMAAYDYHFYITKDNTQCHWIKCPCRNGYQD